jgi:hypothetical protein
MGIQYMAQNRERARTLGGRELPLDAMKALRYVREHRRLPAPPEELADLDREIRGLERTKLLNDLDDLTGPNRIALVKLEKPGADLTHDERVRLMAWLARVEKIRDTYKDHLHLAHLLAVGDGGDPVLRDLNIAYLFLAAASNADIYRELGYVGGEWDKPQPHLEKAIDGLTAGALGEHLADGNWFGPPRGLRSLPDDPIQRSRILTLYAEYLELATVRNAYADFGGLDLPLLKDGPKILSRSDVRQEKDADAYLRDTVEALAQRLMEHLGMSAE